MSTTLAVAFALLPLFVMLLGVAAISFLVCIEDSGTETMFTVTYEIITYESAEYGDAADCGVIADKLSLREALSYVNATDSCHCSQSSIEASDSDIESARWFTVYNSADYISGNYENRSLHMPNSVTGASRRRIARLLGIRNA